MAMVRAHISNIAEVGFFYPDDVTNELDDVLATIAPRTSCLG